MEGALHTIPGSGDMVQGSLKGEPLCQDEVANNNGGGSTHLHVQQMFFKLKGNFTFK